MEILKASSCSLLNHVVRKHSMVAGHQFRDRVAEHHAAVERHILFDDRRLAVFLRHNQVARVCHRRRYRPGRDKQQVDGLLNYRAARDVNVPAVFRESRVQSAESIAAHVKVTAHVQRNRFRTSGDLPSHAADLHTIRQVAQRKRVPAQSTHPGTPVDRQRLQSGTAQVPFATTGRGRSARAEREFAR